MTEERKLINTLMYMVYGDALGLANENNVEGANELRSFLYSYNKNIKIRKPIGQYSYITELTLITIKSLRDDAKDFKVTIDYKRLYEELKLWRYYRHGNPENIISKLAATNNYYKSDFYWKDTRGHSISRIIPILLANKNFHSAEVEIYKNVLYLNRHPQVLLTALLLARTVFILLEKGFCEKETLVQELKDYIIGFKWQELDPNNDLSKSYSIQFEKEKVQYIMSLDRILWMSNKGREKWDSQAIYIKALKNFYKLQDELEILEHEDVPREDWKEVLAISYGLWGVNQKEFLQDTNPIKDQEFIHSMGQYLHKLRTYKINRKPYIRPEEHIDIFNLQKDDHVHHPLLSTTKVKERVETSGVIQLFLSTKSGTYTFVKEKPSKS
ncbi:MAG: ADP-ribosylglycohydrolase family protein [Clostridiaceae bacterium]|nr:ADP-ribosylglycohydrolase family protein [Clostridiaceae bacterium]